MPQLLIKTHCSFPLELLKMISQLPKQHSGSLLVCVKLFFSLLADFKLDVQCAHAAAWTQLKLQRQLFVPAHAIGINRLSDEEYPAQMREERAG